MDKIVAFMEGGEWGDGRDCTHGFSLCRYSYNDSVHPRQVGGRHLTGNPKIFHWGPLNHRGKKNVQNVLMGAGACRGV